VPGKEHFIVFNHVSRDYFRTMEMQVRAVRPFSAQDGPKAQLAAIINEAVAQRCFANENPKGVGIDRRVYERDLAPFDLDGFVDSDLLAQ